MAEKIVDLTMEDSKRTLFLSKPKKDIRPKRPSKLGQNGIRTLEFDDALVLQVAKSALQNAGTACQRDVRANGDSGIYRKIQPGSLAVECEINRVLSRDKPLRRV